MKHGMVFSGTPCSIVHSLILPGLVSVNQVVKEEKEVKEVKEEEVNMVVYMQPGICMTLQFIFPHWININQDGTWPPQTQTQDTSAPKNITFGI